MPLNEVEHRASHCSGKAFLLPQKTRMPAAEIPSVVLVGTGVVGRAILKAHVDAGVSVCLADQDTDSIQAALAELSTSGAVDASWQTTATDVGGLDVVSLTAKDFIPTPRPFLIIESIPERLDIKKAFFQDIESNLPDDTVLCSNTSTLRIENIASDLNRPERVCGMHFFMPVDQRSAVEIVRTNETTDAVVDACQSHANLIQKTPLIVSDTPGFVVNRLLSPYLNQSLLLLAHGVSAEQIEQAALEYGMPFSPLELIDWIGTRTMFDAGRSFWQAFPTRIDPSPIVPALVKAKRAGRSVGAGLYDYDSGIRSKNLSPQTMELVDKYQLDPLYLTNNDVMQLLAIPMWIEACLAAQADVVRSRNDFNIAMSGGLGYTSPTGWIEFFRTMGVSTIEEAIGKWCHRFRSMSKPDDLDLKQLLTN